MFSFLTSYLRPLKPEVDPTALEAAMAVAEIAGVAKWVFSTTGCDICHENTRRWML